MTTENAARRRTDRPVGFTMIGVGITLIGLLCALPHGANGWFEYATGAAVLMVALTLVVHGMGRARRR